MTNFPREMATETRDLPHQFAGTETADSLGSPWRRCIECGAEPDDSRHTVWQTQQLAEKASATFDRELGS